MRPRKDGTLWVTYYYNGRDDNGNRIEIPLGSDLNEAKRQWAELECVTAPVDTGFMTHIFDRYIKAILPQKARSTQKDSAVWRSLFLLLLLLVLFLFCCLSSACSTLSMSLLNWAWRLWTSATAAV